MSGLSRREFVLGAGAGGLGLLVGGCGRLPWQVEPPAQTPRVAWLASRPPEVNDFIGTFRQGMSELGHEEGQQFALEYHSYGALENLPVMAADVAQSSPNVIVMHGGTDVARIIAAAASTIPVVGLTLADPVEAGLIVSLARPGGNLTGLATLSRPLLGKRLQLLKDTAPSLRRVAAIYSPAGSAPDAVSLLELAATSLDLELQPVPVRTGDELDTAFQAVLKGEAAALTVLGSAVTALNRERIAEFALDHRLLGIGPSPEYPASGLLMSYSGPRNADSGRRGAYYVDRILKGASPADLPVEQPMTFDFVVNLKTARELGITFPNEIMLQVTEVIGQ